MRHDHNFYEKRLEKMTKREYTERLKELLSGGRKAYMLYFTICSTFSIINTS
jgi:hypothetical protein